MKPQRTIIQWPQDRLLKALKVVIDEQSFSPLQKRMMVKKLTKLARRGNLFLQDFDTEWMYRLCAASLMQHDYHWFAWEWRSPWASELATKVWAYPRWTDQRRILVVAEQGVGDEIVFASCYHELAKDVDEAWIECDPRLIPIFERSFPENLHFIDRFMGGKRRIVPRAADYPRIRKGLPIEAFIMAGNVPKLYRQSVQDFPKNKDGFLHVEPVGYDVYTRKFAYYPSIGCSWKGRQGEIEPIEAGVSLQYGTTDHGSLFVVPGIDLKWDLDGVFTLISTLSKVVTTTNAVAHMAGALGVPTDVIKPPPIYATKEDGFNNRVQPWWPEDRNDWYPSITMYRNQREWRTSQRC